MEPSEEGENSVNGNSPPGSAPLVPVTLVLGGARSGKSRHAEALACASGLERGYIATATPFDAEMAARIACHRADRASAGWVTIEEERALADVIAREARSDRVLLVDCLTLWLNNLFFANDDIEAAQASLIAALEAAKGPVILVSNEVGLGLVPETTLGRNFRDAQGRLNQAVAAVATNVVFVAAGLPLRLK